MVPGLGVAEVLGDLPCRLRFLGDPRYFGGTPKCSRLRRGGRSLRSGTPKYMNLGDCHAWRVDHFCYTQGSRRAHAVQTQRIGVAQVLKSDASVPQKKTFPPKVPPRRRRGSPSEARVGGVPRAKREN